ncbi:InlB B-repeat-containing protein [uncultured Methanolobus sp.]|uniref:InlB B-repeat-containing protein n=1 Tax=uncultured Methanolobus sp. TaxID=218300 RepID=UPI0029C81F98|nr:InlB B-repeat-containing protein [uncultured Methanolobus sp.]
MKYRLNDKKDLFGRSFILILVVMIFAFVVTTSGCLDNYSENDKTVIDDEIGADDVSESNNNELKSSNSDNSENEKVYFATPDDSGEMEPINEILKQKVLVPITSGGKKSSSSSSGSAGATPVMVTGITVTGTGSATSVILDQALQMNADVVPASATNKSVFWTIVNGTGNATIDSNGLLTGKALGNITVKATANDASGVEGILLVTVVEPPVLVTGITVNTAGSVTNVISGQTLQMNASVLPSNATDKGITWSVINGTGSATIDVSGLLTAIKVGNLTVKATANDASGIEGSMFVTVDPILVTDINVTGAGSATMLVNGETLQMNADVLPADATDSSVTWSVINETGNATIGANGLLTATGIGTVTVKATANDASATVGTSNITIAPMVYTVTFNKNNGDTDANPLSKNVAEGSIIDSLPTAPTKTGHTFEGWNTESDGSGTSFTTATVVNSDITVYAVWKPISYTVTFNKNGGDVDASPSSDTADYGTSLASLPTAPTKTGNTFEGWNTESDGLGTYFTTSTVVTEDITVYATWQLAIYTVTFDKNSGDIDASPTSDTADYGTSLASLPTVPTKTGHTFEGWNTESDGSGTSFTPSTVVTDDITVYAVWKPISYTVTFDKNGGDVDASPTSDTADYGTSLASLPTVPTKTGHTFEGWNTESDGSGTSFTPSTVVTDDITVYAVWKPISYTVTFDKNGGDVDASPTSDTADYGTSLASLPTVPTKTGHTFEGWNTESDGSGTSFTTATVVNSDITVYAIWKPISYTVTFNKNGGDVDASPTSDTADYGTSLASLPTVPTKTGHTFEGWNTESDGSGTSFTTATVVNSDITVYAVWKPISYTVTFNKNGGDVDASPTSDTADYGTSLASLPTVPTKTGHTFEGWNTESDGSGTSFTTATVVNSDITVYATWQLAIYTVTFDKNSGDIDASPSSDTAEYGTSLASLPTAPTKTGHTFEDWNTESDGSGTSFTTATIVNSDITVYAVWKPISYTVTFNKNGGDVDASPTSDTADYGTSLASLPTAPTKTGHTFEGWNTESDGSGTSFTTSTVVTEDITVYATWQLAIYTVTFDKNSGDIDASPSSDTADYGTTLASLPTAPTKTGHSFEGWNTESDGSGTSFTTATVVNSDITVYAVWKPISYTVTFDKNGGDVDASPTSDTADYGTTLDSLPTEPTKEDHSFEGWNTESDGTGASFTIATVITEDITVYAMWEEIILVPAGTLLDAAQGSDFTGVLYTRDSKLYYNQESNDKWSGESWVGNGTEGRIAIDSSDNVHAAYTTDGKIGYRIFDGSSWSAEELILSNNAGICSKPDIAVDVDGGAHITYTDSRGQLGGYSEKDDIMYTNSSSSFVKTVVYNGYYESYGGADYYGSYYLKGSYITVDANNNYYILTHNEAYSKSMQYIDRSYAVVVYSNIGTGNTPVITSSRSVDKTGIYDMITRGGKPYALYRHNDVQSSELSVSGNVINFVNTITSSVSSVYSHDVLSGDIVVGSKSGSNLQTTYNGVSVTNSSIVVVGNAVSIVNDGTNFYAFYTDNADSNIKKMLILPLVAV